MIGINKSKIILVIALLILLILLLRTCKEPTTVKRDSSFDTGSEWSILPPTSTFIFGFNTSQLLDKVDFEDLRTSSAYVEKLRPSFQQNPPLTIIAADPLGSGVDLNKKSTFFVEAGNHANEVISVIVIPLKNKSTFDNALDKQRLSGRIQKSKLYSQIVIDALTTCAWNENFVVSLSSVAGFDKSSKFNEIFNPNARKYFDEHQEIIEHVYQSEKDVSFWLDMSLYAKNQIFPVAQGRDLMDIGLLDGIIYKGHLESGKGSIEIDMDLVLNPFLTKIENRIFSEHFDPTMLNFLPSRKMSIGMTTSINISGLLNLAFIKAGNRAKVRNDLRPYGLLINDITDVFSGDILFTSYQNENNKYSTILGLKIKDQLKFDQVVKVGQDLGYLREEMVDRFVMPQAINTLTPLYTNYEDRLPRMQKMGDYIFISGDQLILDEITTKTLTTEILPQYQPLINEGKFAFVGDLLLDAIIKNKGNSKLDQYTITYNADHINGVVDFKDKTTNILKQLLEL